MCVESLSEFFKSCLSEFPADKPEAALCDFEAAVKKRKYDLQDKTIIGAILKEEGDSLKESFAESFGKWLKKNRAENPDSGNWNAEKSAKAAEIFCLSLESLVNYYYSNVIAGQFSGR